MIKLNLKSVAMSTFVLAATAFAPAAWAGELSVTFINPGGAKGFWGNVSGTMQAAAKDLGIKLEVIHTNRDRFKMVNAAKEVAGRANKPKYVVMVNELQQGPVMLEATEKAGIKSFLLLNKLTGKQEGKHGKARGKLANLLGSITPDNEIAGYEMGKSLIEAAKAKGMADDGVTILALLGDKATPAALQREAGLKRAVKEAGNAKIVRAISVQWKKDKAKALTSKFLERQKVDAVWAANDPISFGAQEAAKAKGLTPGKDILFVGLNWSSDALKAVKDGSMTLTHGGHFFAGAWSMVLLRDHNDGKDFGASKPDFAFPMSAVTPAKADEFIKKLGAGDWDSINFASFSKSKGGRSDYDFSSNAILAAAK